MTKDNPGAAPARRQFLHRCLASAGALLGLAALRQTAVAAPDAEGAVEVAPLAQRGYRETEHVRAYYDAARF